MGNLSSADFFPNQLFQKMLSGTISECQAVLIQIRTDILYLGPNCLRRFSVATSKKKINGKISPGYYYHLSFSPAGLKLEGYLREIVSLN